MLVPQKQSQTPHQSWIGVFEWFGLHPDPADFTAYRKGWRSQLSELSSSACKLRSPEMRLGWLCKLPLFGRGYATLANCNYLPAILNMENSDEDSIEPFKPVRLTKIRPSIYQGKRDITFSEAQIKDLESSFERNSNLVTVGNKKVKAMSKVQFRSIMGLLGQN